jgi:hypothetical protein
MNAFLQILHKQCAKTNELYEVSKLDNSDKTRFSLVNNTYNYELKNCSLEYFDKLVIITFNILLLTPIYNTKTKFGFLSSIRDNKFYDDTTKQIIYEIFYEVQKKYNALNRLAYRYKYSRSPIAINTDLSLANIKSSNKNTIIILQNNQKYLFTLFDLKKIIDTSLSNSPYHFSHPLPIKNPYNNMPFEKSNLYNIYFFMKKSDFVIPTLFHQYFLCNFNLSKFQEENEVLIQKFHLTQYLRNLSSKDLKKEILFMLKQNKYSKKIKIDPEFPTDKLIEIFKPYLELFYKQSYSIDTNAKIMAKNELHIKLKVFYNFNPIFGRKTISKKKQENDKLCLNDNHIQFQKRNYNKNYDISHITLCDNNNIIDNESESESDTSTSSEEDNNIVGNNRTRNIHVFHV